jgi:hypothetical protein
MSTSVDNNKDLENLLTPDYEKHYQELAARLREQASLRVEPGDIWGIVCGGEAAAKAALMSAERERDLIADISVLWVQLTFLDLGSLGISPASARLIVLTRLVVEDVPVSHFLKQELMSAVVNAVESQVAAAKFQ